MWIKIRNILLFEPFWGTFERGGERYGAKKIPDITIRDCLTN